MSISRRSIAKRVPIIRSDMMRYALLLLWGLLGSLLMSSGPAVALELIYPADGTYVLRSDYLIVRGGDNPVLDGISIEINGIKSDVFTVSNPQYRTAFGDFLIVEPDLDPGENLIVVEGYADGKPPLKTSAKVFFLKDLAAVPPKGYQPYVMHVPEREALCVKCHNMTPTAKALAGVTATNPCASCHARMLNRKHVHGPAGVYQCTYCHDEKSAPAKYQVKPQSDLSLCGDCHSDKVEEFRKNKFVHGPIEAGMCLVCHDSHATDEIAQLNQPVNVLCLSCHEGVDTAVHVLRGISSGKSHPLQGSVDPSNSGRSFSCASCHNPHGGMGEKLFVRDISDRMLLCRVCHQK
ncbi:MAG: cytochrome C [Desulfuromonas sp.]|nr:cytochrome C [Desulfuromonas sp.]